MVDAAMRCAYCQGKTTADCVIRVAFAQRVCAGKAACTARHQTATQRLLRGASLRKKGELALWPQSERASDAAGCCLVSATCDETIDVPAAADRHAAIYHL
ncbi:hypothetical protein XarbCFBP7629_07245 [Xanthomonas arboricola]|nr:hypothetical protein XarbCFBP7629_07245 [Xanthomonas arboricola]